MRRRIRDAVRGGVRILGGTAGEKNSSARAIGPHSMRQLRPQSAAAVARKSVEPIVRNEEQNKRSQKQRMFRRELEWQKHKPYKPPLQQCISSERMAFGHDLDRSAPVARTARTATNTQKISEQDFQTGNFGNEFDKVRRMRIKAAAQANTLWRATGLGNRKWSPEGKRIGSDGEIVVEGEAGKKDYADAFMKSDMASLFSMGPSKSHRKMLEHMKRSSHQLHGYFRPSSATRNVRGSWGSKALDLQGLSQELPKDCIDELRTRAMSQEAHILEKMVRNLKFESRVVNKRTPGAGRLRVNVDYMLDTPPEADSLYAKR